MTVFLGALGLTAMLLCGGLLFHLGQSGAPGSGLGRMLGSALVGLPYLVGVGVAFGAAAARGGLVAVWPGAPAPLRVVLLLGLALGAAVVAVATAGLAPARDEATAALVQRMVAAALLLVLPAAAALGLFPTLTGDKTAELARVAWALLVTGLLAGALLLVQQQRSAQAARQAAKDLEARAPGAKVWQRSPAGWTYDGEPFQAADPDTLAPLGREFARDAVQGYYRGRPVPGSHGPSFEALGRHEARDHRAVYWADTFRRGQDYYLIVHVRIHALPGADPARYQVLGHGHGRDDRQVFFQGRPVAGVRDVGSFELISADLARDAHQGYFVRRPVQGSEGASFERVDPTDDAWVRDRHRAWHLGRVAPERGGPRVPQAVELAGARPAALRLLGRGYASDGHRTWWQGQAVKDADAATFVVLDDRPAADGEAAADNDPPDARDARGDFRAGRRVPSAPSGSEGRR